MEFRILGPLQVVDGGAEVPITGRNERALLAVLLIHVGEVVSTDRLIEALWGDDLPANAANALQARVSRLRRALGPDAIKTKPPGYVLDVVPDAVDARRFERLVREAARNGDASATLESAFSLWRGSALADFAYEPFVQAEVTRLEELRRTAIEDRIEAQLAAGRHSEIVGELEILAAEHPSRERLRGQLMLALYRSGRQADALKAYEETRRFLSEDLGVDPSPELRRIHQSILEQAPDIVAPPRLVRSSPDSLPIRITSFLGRRREIAELKSLLGDYRMVTLTGPGGAGKTSLAVETAAAVRDRFPGGTWFVDLSSVRDPGVVPAQVAAALGLREALAEEREVTDRIIDRVRSAELLLVLDNCEHLVDACAHLCEAMLRSSRSLRILATSREGLAIAGELHWAVPPMSVPSWPIPLEALTGYDSVRLFCERAAAVRPGFALEPADGAAVAQICARLDGMPLAIELAAARVKAFSVQEIASRLDDRFRLLTSGTRTADQRQRTLRGTIDWSHELLTDAERTLLRRLAVFQGGFSLDAAEGICSGDGLDPADVLDVLSRLVDRSLVISDGSQYRMLETIHDYARDRLDEAGESEMFDNRHARWFAGLADANGWPPATEEQIGRLEDDRYNLRTATYRFLQTGDFDAALRLCGALAWFSFLGHQEQGRRIVYALLDAAPPERTWARAVALQAAGLVDAFHPNARSLAASRESASIFEELGDRAMAARSVTLVALGVLRFEHDPATAERLLREATVELRELGDLWGEATAWYVDMACRLAVADLAGARSSGSRALDLFRRVGEPWGISATQQVLGIALRLVGDLDGAERLAIESLDAGRAMRLPYVAYAATSQLADVARLRGDRERARRLCEEAYALSEDVGYREGAAISWLTLAGMARLDGDLEHARALCRDAIAVIRDYGMTQTVAWAECALGLVEEMAGNLDEAELHLTEAVRSAQETQDLLALALALECSACLAVARGSADLGARLLGAASSMRTGAGAPLHPLDRFDVDRAEAGARERLGDDGFRSAFEAGSAMDAREAVAVATAHR